MRYPAAITILLPIALVLSACGQRFSNANIDVVNRELERANTAAEKGIKENGVTPKLVESILGPPKSIESHKLDLETQKKEVEVVRYTYVQDGETLELHFFDNKLISSVPHLGVKPPASETTPP